MAARRERRPRRDIHAEVTETIRAQLQNGIRPWMRPWEGGSEGAHQGAGLPLRDTGDHYNGINVLVLWSAAAAAGYTRPTWMTFNQAKRHGGRVRKGEKGQQVVYGDRVQKVERDPETGDEQRRGYGFLKTFTVFNVEQIDGLDERWHRTYAEIHPVNRDERREGLDGFFRALGIDIRHGGDEAYYVLADDYIQMPRYEFFHDSEAYYTTLAHESIHWTRHASRLDRKFRGSYQVPYAKEELVAEIGSAFLSAELGIAPAVREDHADYIGAWLRVLEDDSKAIFRAASHASKAVAWLRDRARAMTENLQSGIDAGDESVAAGQPGLPFDEGAMPVWPVRGVGPDAVQGELFRRTPDALAAQTARRFVAEAEACRKTGDADAAAALLDASRHIDVDVPDVANAIQAAAFIHGAGGGDAADWLAGFRRDARTLLRGERAAGHDLGTGQAHAGRRGVSF